MKRKILVVDDEKDIALALKIRLKDNGYNVVIAFDSIQAYTAAQKENPDVIILDVFIPGGGGFVVAERLKRSPSTQHIPIIFLTGISGEEERAFRMGAFAYLTKPYNPPVLLDEVRRALESSPYSKA